MHLADAIWEFFFPTPHICVLCEKNVDIIGLCENCRERYGLKKLRYGTCGRCGTFGVRAERCGVCRHWPGYLLGAKSLWPYQEEVRQGIAGFKYRNEPWRGRIYGEALADLLPKEAELIVPVPLHTGRLHERGYNQSALLAKYLSQAVGVPWANVLKRVYATPHQVGLSRDERRTNLRNAFVLSSPQEIQNRYVVIVDDVLTTGSTIEACAKVLHQGGAKGIFALTLAASVE